MIKKIILLGMLVAACGKGTTGNPADTVTVDTTKPDTVVVDSTVTDTSVVTPFPGDTTPPVNTDSVITADTIVFADTIGTDTLIVPDSVVDTANVDTVRETAADKKPSVTLMGIPFGCSGCLIADIPAPVTFSLDGYNAGNVVDRINVARAKGQHLMMNLMGGAHDNYKTAGKFDVTKWQNKLNTYNTKAVVAALIQGFKDHTVKGISVMDEPFQEDKPGNEEKSWGPHGWMTKTKVDDLCARVKQVIPNAAVGVVHDHNQFYPEVGYKTCDFLASQYRESKGPPRTFVTDAVNWTKKYHMSLIAMLNYLHGGTPSTTCPKYGDDPTGRLCPMTAVQIDSVGNIFGKSGACAVGGWRYEAEYFTRKDITAALKSVTTSLSKLPAKECRRT